VRFRLQDRLGDRFAPACQAAADRVEQEQIRLLDRCGRNPIRIERADRAREQPCRRFLFRAFGHVTSFAVWAAMNYRPGRLNADASE
jgi:hypothetical protein